MYGTSIKNNFTLIRHLNKNYTLAFFSEKLGNLQISKIKWTITNLTIRYYDLTLDNQNDKKNNRN